MPVRFVEPAQRARARTTTIQRQKNLQANTDPARASIQTVAEKKPIVAPPAPPSSPKPIPVPTRPAQPVPIDGALRAKAHLESARGEEHSAFLDFVDKLLSPDSRKPLTFSGNGICHDPRSRVVHVDITANTSQGGHAVKAFKFLTHEELNPEQYADKPKIISQNTPLDVFLTILDYLDEATATCLSLVCRSFYQLHRIRYPNGVSLQSQTTSTIAGRSEQFYLYEILRSWMPKELNYYAINNFKDGKYLTRKQCLDKVLEKNKGVHRFNKTGCWGIWDEEQEVAALQYGAYHEVVFRLCHEKVKIKGREEYVGFRLHRTVETPKRPWVIFGLTESNDWRQTPRILT